MKAITIEKFGAPLVMSVQTVPKPQPKPHDLLIKVHASALNRCDLLQRRGLYPPLPHHSPIMGIEIAGEVVHCGNQTSDFQIGDRVFGYVNGGGYAQYCLQDAAFATHLPDHWSYAEGAACAEAFQTANEALFIYGKLLPAGSVLIHAGASSIGLAAIQLAKTVNAEVIVTVGTEEKADFCQKLGADLAINYETQDFITEIKQFTHKKGVDLIIDLVGPAYFSQNMACLKVDGRWIAIGCLSGAKGELNFASLIEKRLDIKGHNTRSRTLPEQRLIADRFRRDCWPFLQENKIKPIIDSVFPFSQVTAAHQRMEENLNIGKIILLQEHVSDAQATRGINIAE